MDLLTGFVTILAAIACGALLAHGGVLDDRSQRALAEVSFFVATPALMLLVVSGMELRGAGVNLGVSAIALATCFLLYAAWAAQRGQGTGQVLIGALCSSYVNAGNLGIAVAAYIVGDTGVVVPTLLVQMLVVQPAALAVLDHLAGRGSGVRSVLLRLVSNPLTVAAMAGVVLATTGWHLPTLVDAPVRLLAGLAIPALLISYGAAVRLSPPPGRAGRNREVLAATVLKLAVMPVVAWIVARGFGLEDRALLGVVITASLPTAQNIFLHATRYRTGEDVARETILVTTLGSLPVALLIALLLG